MELVFQRRHALITAVFFFAVICCVCIGKLITKTIKPQQKVLIIGLDGWRWDFVQQHNEKLPNIVHLEQQGVTAGYVQNVFPTDTYPNFYSIVTGLYPEHHGIIDNQMYDINTKDKFSMKTTESKWWDEAEPIWVTNQIQGFKSGLIYWPGFNVKIKGKLPTYSADSAKYINPVVEFSGKPMPHTERIDLSLEWLKQPDVTFAAIYFENVDMSIHSSGEEKIHNAMKTLDSTFAYLKKQLDSLSMSKDVNVIVVGDHGGKNVNHNKIIRLKDYIDVRSYAILATGKTFVSIYPKPGQVDMIYSKLHNAHPHMTVYRKWELPYHMHIKNNKRTAPLLLLADPGWLIDSDFEKGEYFKGKEFYKGEHGYSNFNRAMNPGFFGFGPCFKRGLNIKNIRIIDLYPIMCQIIGLRPKKSDGSLNNVKGILKHKCLR